MKVGDKIYCKRTYSTNIYWGQPKGYDRVHFIKDNFYKIVAESEYGFVLISEISDNRSMSKDNVRWLFYSESEYRKLKLQKINESLGK